MWDKKRNPANEAHSVSLVSAAQGIMTSDETMIAISIRRLFNYHRRHAMKKSIIEGREIFQHLTHKQIAEIHDAAEIRNIEADQIIFDQKQEVKNFYILLEGEISLRLPGTRDRTPAKFSLEIDRIKGYGVFGPGYLFGIKRHMLRARAVKRSKVLMLDSKHFLEIIKENGSETLILSYMAKVYFQRYINAMKEFQQLMDRELSLEHDLL